MNEHITMFDRLSNGLAHQAPPSPAADAWTPIVPVPDKVEFAVPRHRLGPPLATWHYLNADSELLMVVCRWETAAGKSIHPATYCENAFGERMARWQGIAAPRPLYGLDRLAARPTSPVLVVEGEKTADAASALMPGYVVITSSGGSSAAEKSDWSAIAGRDVTIWRDADEPGRKYERDVVDFSSRAGAARLRVVSVPADWPDGWDLADDLPQGVTTATFAVMMNEAIPVPGALTGPDMNVVRRAAAPAPTLDISVFGPLAAWIEQAAASKSTPVDYVAMSILGGVAGIVGASRWVSPWPGWCEPCVLWTMLVGSPSASKSPAMDAMRAPLSEIEREVAASWPETRRAHEAAVVAAAVRREEWEAAVRTAVKSGGVEPQLPPAAVEPQAPQMPRIVIADVTIERAAAILSSNPRGLILWRDECAAWLGNMGKYGDGDRAFWLEANGARPYTVDRQKLPEPLRIEHLAISIVGGIQPDRLATLLMSGDDDGLGARFLFSWPEIVPPRRPRFRPEGEIVTRAMRRLRSLEFGRDPKTGDSIPVTLPIQADALDAFQDWREQHHASSQGVSGMMASAYGKMAGQALRLAIALELLWWAAGPDGTSEPAQVSGDALGAALDLIESYFRPMLARVLGEAALPAGDRLGATLAREIQRRRVDRLNATQVRREWRLPGLRESAQVMAAVGVLEEARWLKAIGERDGSTLGRKRLDFAVDPRVHRGRS